MYRSLGLSGDGSKAAVKRCHVESEIGYPVANNDLAPGVGREARFNQSAFELVTTFGLHHWLAMDQNAAPGPIRALFTLQADIAALRATSATAKSRLMQRRVLGLTKQGQAALKGKRSTLRPWRNSMSAPRQSG